MEARSLVQVRQMMRLAYRLKPGKYILSKIAMNMTKNPKDYGNAFTYGTLRLLKDENIIAEDGDGMFDFNREKLWNELETNIIIENIKYKVKMPVLVTTLELEWRTWKCDFDES